MPIHTTYTQARGLLETAHLLRSPENAERLSRALERARAETVEPQSVDQLRQEVGLAPSVPTSGSDTP